MAIERASVNPTWLDRAIGFVSPERALRRMRAKVATELVARHYEAVAATRRTQGWQRPIGDANAVVGPALSRLRASARDLVRNSGHAKNALNKIGDHVVGWGIVAKPKPRNAAALDVWRRWAESTDCDADGRLDFAGLQKLVVRTVAESGEVLVRRRLRRPEDGLAIPLQLQVLDPDYIDTDRNETQRDTNGTILRRIVHGVEFDALGRRAAYWLYPDHPGSMDISGLGFGAAASRRIPAEGILHVYDVERPGQVRGPSWFAPILLKFKDYDEYSDATLMKQKIAACLAVITSDADGSASPLGTGDSTQSPEVDSLEPGMILNVPPGRNVEVVQPPTVREHADFSRFTLREIAAGIGLCYEELAEDFSNVNFSSARMSRLSHWDRVHHWRWQMMVPQFCAPVWAWAMQAAAIMGLATAEGAVWTAPPMPMLEPDKEGLAHQRNIRTGTRTLPQVLRELGEDPDEILEEIAETNKKLDKLGIVLDSDPRKTTQAGNPFTPPAEEPPPSSQPPKPDPDTDDAEDEEDDEEERQHREKLALIDALRAANARKTEVHVDARTSIEPGAVSVDARTAIEAGAVQVAPAAVNVDARTSIHEGAVRTQLELPLTIADQVHVPARRQRIERGPDGEIAAVENEGAPMQVVVPRAAGRKKKPSDGDE